MRYLLSAFVVFFAAVLFSAGALHNGYPILTPDSDAYLMNGAFLHVSPVRPIVYSLFVRWFGSSGTLWTVVLAQNVWLALVLLLWLRGHFRGPALLVGFPTLAALLVATTALPWTQGEIMADALTPICLLSFLCLLSSPRRGAPETIFLEGTFLFTSAAHFTHLPIVLGTLFGIHRWIRRERELRLVCLAGLSLLSLAALNRALGAGFVCGETPGVFLMARMYESGLLARSLEENCAGERTLFCDEPPARRRGDINFFLWSAKSPHARIAALPGRDREYREILWRIFAAHPWAFVKVLVAPLPKQLATFAAGDAVPSPFPQKLTQLMLQQLYPSDAIRFRRSKQQRGELRFAASEPTRQRMVLLSSLLFVFLALSGEASLATAAVVAAVVVNAALCGALTGGWARYEARLIWLLPLVTLVDLARMIRRRRAFWPLEPLVPIRRGEVPR